MFCGASVEVSLSSSQFVAGTQPLNALAFVFDGLHYGVSDFQYAAFSMVSCPLDAYGGQLSFEIYYIAFCMILHLNLVLFWRANLK